MAIACQTSPIGLNVYFRRFNASLCAALVGKGSFESLAVNYHEWPLTVEVV